jgi:alkylation response protein AidB-like acyl-CoA dehydrogenase
VLDLALTPEQEMLRRAARDFVVRECPLVLVRGAIESKAGYSRSLWDKISSLGWPGLLIHEQYGGAGGSLTAAAVLFEELGRGLVPVPLHSAMLAAAIIERCGSEEQRERLLPAIAAGDRVAAVAFTESPYGWSPEDVNATVTRPDDVARISGRKCYVPDATAADDLVVAVRANDEIVPVLVARGQAGVTERRMPAFSMQPLSDIDLSQAEVEAVNVLSPGWIAIEMALDIGAVMLCAYMAGACRRVYEMTMEYAAHRVQFGQPIARFQRVQDRLIDILNAADAAKWTAYDATWKLQNTMADAPLAVSTAKAVASEAFYAACEDAHHVHAGVGSDKAYGLYLYTRASRGYYHYLGTPAHHRDRIARLLLT